MKKKYETEIKQDDCSEASPMKICFQSTIKRSLLRFLGLKDIRKLRFVSKQFNAQTTPILFDHFYVNLDYVKLDSSFEMKHPFTKIKCRASKKLKQYSEIEHSVFCFQSESSYDCPRLTSHLNLVGEEFKHFLIVLKFLVILIAL